MQELGAALRRQRLSLGMELEDVEERTKIRRRYLEALEAGDWSILPGDVYARGFVRAYAECVGLDGLKLLEQYVDEPRAEQLLRPSAQRDGDRRLDTRTEGEGAPNHDVLRTGSTSGGVTVPTGLEPDHPPRRSDGAQRAGAIEREEPLPRATSVGSQAEGAKPIAARDSLPYTPPSRPTARTAHPKPVHPRGRRRGGGAWGQGAAVVAAFAVIAGAWWLLSGPHTHRGGSVAAGTGNRTTVNTASNGTVSGGTGNAAEANAVNSAATNTTGSSNEVGQTGNSVGASASAVVSPQPFTPGQGTFTVLVSAPGPLVVNATATSGQSWVEVLADGKVVDGNDFIVSGATKTWSGSQELRLKLGAVPVVQLTVNGTAVPLPSVNAPIWVVVKRSASA
ncbi:MAG: DUF4115 domain-containing protein [Alicyclobacillus sp.]|nr:DUF4115 domain-containing protein [Alicyclobacillus sp.]